MSSHYAPPGSAVADVEIAGGNITGEMIEAMRGTKSWVMLIGILMFIAAVFTVIAAVARMFGSSMMMGRTPAGAPPTALFMGMGVAYLFFALIYVFLGLHLVKYSSAIGRLLASGQSADMEDALNQQRKFWKLSGVLALIMIVFFVIAMIAAIAIPSYMAMSGAIPHAR
jgi:hypothetical protein